MYIFLQSLFLNMESLTVDCFHLNAKILTIPIHFLHPYVTPGFMLICKIMTLYLKIKLYIIN